MSAIFIVYNCVRNCRLFILFSGQAGTPVLPPEQRRGNQIVESPPESRKRIAGFSPNVFFLGIVSMLTDISSEMIFTLVPLFLANVLGASTTVIGFIDGLSNSADSLFRILSGWVSDKVGKRKSLAVSGYGLSTIVKPFMYIALVWSAVLAIRFLDRIGKGLRTSPRDALIADSISKGERGRSFGFHRAMDSFGAVVGLGIAAAIIYSTERGAVALTLEAYRWMVIAGSIPAVLAVLVLLTLVHEEKKKSSDPKPLSGSPLNKAENSFSLRFKLFLAIMAVFTLGNSGNAFIILRAQNVGSSVFHVALLLVLYNVTYTAISFPAGVLSDRLGRRRVIMLGWFIFALVYLGFATSTEVWHIWVLFACYGIYNGIVEGVARAFVADLVPAQRRGTAYGLYNGIASLFLLPAGVIAGLLWSAINPAAPFYFGAGLALLATLGMLTLIREH